MIEARDAAMVSAIDAAPGRFFPAFERHATVMVKAAVAFREIVADQPQPREGISRES